MFGGLPMTGVIVRSAANVQAGARTKWSAVLHGIWLLLFVTLCGPLLGFIPTAALAGILVYTGFRLIDYREFARQWKHDRTDALIMLTTLVVIVADDLLAGVVTGFVLSAIKLLIRFTRVDVRVSSVRKSHSEPTLVVHIAGAATFLRLPVLADRLDTVPHRGEVQFEINRLAYLDEACLDLLQGWIKQREAEGQRVKINPQQLEALERCAPGPKSPNRSSRWSRGESS
jgi:MFS superfamily sulfate permease-like transporter